MASIRFLALQGSVRYYTKELNGKKSLLVYLPLWASNEQIGTILDMGYPVRKYEKNYVMEIPGEEIDEFEKIAIEEMVKP